MSPWRVLEDVPELSLAAIDWRRKWGRHLPRFSRYLRPTNELASSIDCPTVPGGLHTVVVHAPDDIVGVCEVCPTEKLTQADILITRLDLKALCADLATALSLSPGFEAQAPGHYFIGKLVPNPGSRHAVHLCLFNQPSALQEAVLRLTGSGKREFILLTATARMWSTSLRGIVEGSGSRLMCLEEVLGLDGRDDELVASDAWRAFLDSLAPTSTRKKPAATFPTPHGARWNELRIRFLTGDTVSAAIRDARRRVSYAEMGMARKDNANRNVQWEMLEKLAEGHGYYETSLPAHREKEKQQVHRLSKALKAYFQIEGDPIHREGRGWRTVFLIQPEGWKEPPEETWDDA